MTHYQLLRRCGFTHAQALALLSAGFTVRDFWPFGWTS